MSDERDWHVEVAEQSGVVEGDTFVRSNEVGRLLDKHMTRWGSLLERLR